MTRDQPDTDDKPDTGDHPDTDDHPDTAVVFPGQGSQRPGMGRPFHEAWPETRAVFDELDEALGTGPDLRELCFEGTDRTLRATDRAQLAVFAVGIATYRGLLERIGIEPAAVAGHSLGHITALAASGVLDPGPGVQLVRDRGRLMAEVASQAPDGVMVAVLLADPDTVVDACGGRDDVGVAAFNAPRETVISGATGAVEAVREELDRTASRVRFRELDTETAFHSPLVQPVQEAFEPILERVDRSMGEIPVVSDVSARVYTDPGVARTELLDQVTATIDWVGTVRRLGERGITRYVEVPPSGTLGRLIERIEPNATVVTLDTPADATLLV